MTRKLKLLQNSSWIGFVYVLHVVLFSLAFGWLILANTNFWYGTFHDYAGIGKAIDTYGPKNKFKQGFGETTKQQRIAIFELINKSVHDGGKGLEQIMYTSPTAGGTVQLLREPEVIHLQDVANLLTFFKPLFWYALIAWPCMVGFFFYARFYKKSDVYRLPSKFQHVIAIVGLIVFISLPLIIFGAETVFNQLHIWVFPDEHQWFFYYQDSLMSTLMYAPHLFGWIALAWAGLFFTVYAVSQFLVYKVLEYKAKTKAKA